METGRAFLLFMILLFLIANLTACGSNDTENVTDKVGSSEVSEIAGDTAQDADSDTADEITSAPETPEEITLAPETYEDYMKLAAAGYENEDWEIAHDCYHAAKELDESRAEVYRGLSDTYLQMGDVMQALAVLDEGIDKLSMAEGDIEKNGIDLLSQRKEYVLAGMVAVGTNSTTNRYDDDGSILYERVRECDEYGNETRYQSVWYGEGGEISYLTEYQYDGKGNQIEYRYLSYNSDGSIREFQHKSGAYNADGNEIEYTEYDENGNTESMKKYEYDAAGNLIQEINYDNSGKIVRQVKIEYDTAGNETTWQCYDEYGKLSIQRRYTRDERGNLIQYDEYFEGRTKKEEYESDEKGNVIQYIEYDSDGNVNKIREYEYDENGREIKCIRYEDNGTVGYWRESEYDENGNEIRFSSYNITGNQEYCMGESKYDENDRKIYYSYECNGIVTQMWKKVYDEDGYIIKEIDAYYDRDTGQKTGEKVCEYTYDEKKNRTKYSTDYKGKEAENFRWERKYDEDSRGTNFYLYDNEKEVSYQSKTGYDENGRIINYIGYDKYGNVLVKRETEYDTFGKVIRENEYDTAGNLIRYFENEYDDFGSLTRQTMYENGILKSEKKTSYVYHYIGKIDAEAADYTDSDMTLEEYNRKQREIFIRFLNGEEAVRYYINAYNAENGKIVENTITDLLDFEHIRQYKRTLKYTFLDMTGDGIEELIIFCNDDPERLCVIQCSYGILKVIHDLDGRCNAFLVKYNGRTGICHDWGIQSGEDRHYYYFLEEEGKTEIFIDDCERYDESSEDFKHFYSMSDNDSFEERDISKGEYYDIMSGMVEKADIDWQELAVPSR